MYRTSLTGDSKPTNSLLRLTRLIVGSRYRLTETITGVSVMVKLVANGRESSTHFHRDSLCTHCCVGIPISGLDHLI